MIDFRYHLVSIVAVFLALAVGLVVGATALKPKAQEILDRASRIEGQQINHDQAQIDTMQGQINGDLTFAQADAPLVLHNLLAGQQVVLVTAPGSDGATISGVTTALTQAGAKVTGQADLQLAFFDTSTATESSLNTLASAVKPSGVTLGVQTGPQIPDPQIAGQQNAAQVLAPALVTSSGTDLPAKQTKEIVDRFSPSFLQMNYASPATQYSQATLAVVVIPLNPPTAGGSDPSNLALISLAEQLRLSSRGVVLAGSPPGSGPGGAIDELINGTTRFNNLSSVANANTEFGQIEVAQALSFLLSPQHKAGAYGSGTVPSPAPAASPTSTSSPSGNKSHR